MTVDLDRLRAFADRNTGEDGVLILDALFEITGLRKQLSDERYQLERAHYCIDNYIRETERDREPLKEMAIEVMRHRDPPARSPKRQPSDVP